MIEIKKIRVLICDDSPTIVQILKSIFDESIYTEVVGIATDGLEALEKIKNLAPDIVTLDISMPKLDGYEVTKRVMSTNPLPIIIISSHVSNTDMKTTIDALNAGALQVFEKPSGIFQNDFEMIKNKLITCVRVHSEVKLIKRRNNGKLHNPSVNTVLFSKNFAEIVALGVSTGGPETLKEILCSLPKSFPVPIVIVLHITKGFIQGLVTWLQTHCQLNICLAEDNMELFPGHVYFAPDDCHLTVKNGKRPKAILDKGPYVHHVRPSVSMLFGSLAQSYPCTTVAGILTGMGCDGADKLLELKQAGSFTFGQSEESCVIYGMPMQAKKLDAIKKEIDLSAIAEFLTIITKERKGEQCESKGIDSR